MSIAEFQRPLRLDPDVSCDGFELVYADPPWSYNDKMTTRGGASRHYDDLTWAEIAYIIEYFAAAPNCVLQCWHTGPLMNRQIAFLEAVGWKYRGITFDWTKTTKDGSRPRIGNGSASSRATNEWCVMYSRGTGLVRHHAGVPQAIWAPTQAHSEKPPEARERLELLFGDVLRVELFARVQAPDWAAWGDELQT